MKREEGNRQAESWMERRKRGEENKKVERVTF